MKTVLQSYAKRLEFSTVILEYSRNILQVHTNDSEYFTHILMTFQPHLITNLAILPRESIHCHYESFKVVQNNVINQSGINLNTKNDI